MAGAHSALQTELLKPAEDAGRAKRPPIWLAAYSLVLAIWLFGLYLPLFFGGFPTLIDSLDFSYYYAAAQIGLQHGWSHIYDLDLQRQVFFQLHPADDVFDWRRYFVSPPPVAWLVAPLTLLPIVPAFWTFALFSAAAFAVCGWMTTPGSGLAKLALFLTAGCMYPVLIAIQTGQVTPLIAAAVMLAWWLTRRGIQVVAGLVLVVVVLKPQVALLVVPALLLAGKRRLFVVWIAGAVLLAAVSAISLGSQGLDQLRNVLSLEQGQSGNLVWTLADLFGPGPVAVALQLASAVLAFVAAWRHRRSLELVTFAGILGSLLAAPYHNPSDYAMLAPAAWLYVRAGMPSWHWVWLAVGLLGTYLAAGFGPVLVLVFTLGWLGLLVANFPERRPEPALLVQ
jgi:alpha-1,2-mannosyltransferase